MIKKIRQLVKDQADNEDWKYHIVPVVSYAKKLAKLYGIDEEMLELAALLHDIGRLKYGNDDHDVTGAAEAEKILQDHNYSPEIIKEIKHCVESHRGSKDIPPQTIAAKIIANADAMAHFDSVPVLLFWRCQDSSFEEAFKWVDEKIDRDWNKKITLPEARAMMENKYKAIKLVLDSNRQYIQ